MDYTLITLITSTVTPLPYKYQDTDKRIYSRDHTREETGSCSEMSHMPQKRIFKDLLVWLIASTTVHAHLRGLFPLVRGIGGVLSILFFCITMTNILKDMFLQHTSERMLQAAAGNISFQNNCPQSSSLHSFKVGNLISSVYFRKCPFPIQTVFKLIKVFFDTVYSSTLFERNTTF